MATTAWCIEQGGAFECAVKPAEPDCLIALVEKALALPMIRQEDSPPKHHTYPAWFSQLSLKMTTDEAALIQFSALLPTLRQAIDLLIQEALRRTHGRQSSAARLLGISQQALSKRLKNRI
ncbi:MAG: hypothetical protein H6974_09915 [Gammaproteobacteria bacterium]|nr:hypothetical protein [Gammaproteobacteria bacterium]